MATFDTRAEFQLMFLRGHALFHRRKLSDLVSHVQFWATRLDALRVNAHQVGQAALYHMHRAQLLHFLAEALRTDDDKERADPVVEQLTRIADSMCATDLSGEGALSSAFADQAQFEYERALTIVILVGWRGIELEASFHLGMLLREHTPQERQDASSEWWKRWDEELFHQSLEIEKDCGWVLYSPFIHQIRTEFFLKQNAESSLYDVYTAVQRMEQSGFPRSLVLEWKRKAAGLLNDHGRTDEDRLRCAELYEVWARTEMLLPEARALWSRAEELERAQAFHFAAQSRRILGEFDKAEDLLREADTSLKAHQEAGPADTHSEGDASDIFVAIQMQYAWIRHSQGSDEYPARIRELWSTVREGHRDIANILRSLLTIEYEGGSLGGVWPRESLGPLVDPDRPDHPLPGEWFAGDEPLVIRNRLDFRTCQLLRMVDHMPSIPGDTDATLPGVITLWLAGNSLSPFRLLAKCRWLGIDQFGETVIIIARLGLEVGLSIELRDVMVELLDALQFYFHEVEAIDRAELESLNLLLAYRPDEEDYRKRYRKALLESEQMVARELVVRSEADEWFEVANYIDSYFKLFVDDERRAKMINLSASLNPGVLGRLQARWQAQREKIPMLRECLEAGKHQDGLEYCQTMLPAPDENPLWVSKDDLTILDLWLKFARNDGSATPSELAEQSTQLRTMSRRYVSQIAETIADHEVQRLAVRLTNHLNRPSATISTGNPWQVRSRHS